MRQVWIFLLLCVFLYAIGLIYFNWINPPKESQQYINLPEEVGASEPGDSMVLYQQDSVTYLYYYHKAQGAVIPKGGHLVIVQ